jgi:hypothetical protein
MERAGRQPAESFDAINSTLFPDSLKIDDKCRRDRHRKLIRFFGVRFPVPETHLLSRTRARRDDQ